MCNLLGDIFGDRLPVSEAENEDRDPGLSGRFLGQGRGQNIKQLMSYYKDVNIILRSRMVIGQCGKSLVGIFLTVTRRFSE